MIIWPVELPQKFLLEGYQETPGNALLVTEMDSGPAKTRLKNSAVEDNLSGRLKLNYDQRLVFLNFFRNVLRRGAIEFSFPDPVIEGDVLRVRIDGGQYSLVPAKSPGFWILSLAFKVQP